MGAYSELNKEYEKSQEQLKYYQDLAELLAFERDTELKKHMEVIIAKGVLYKMESEVLSALKKNPDSHKAKDSKSRIDQLLNFIDSISSVISENTQYRILLRKSLADRNALFEKSENLQKQLDAVNQAWNQIE